MKLFQCDICRAYVKQVISISVDTEYVGNCGTWSKGEIKGEYCQSCANKISNYIEKGKRFGKLESKT